MELKVWVEGLPKTICGIHKDTTCQDIVKALAYATKKRGRFVLIERWCQTDKVLAPTDNLMHLLQQKGEYWQHNVQLILRKTDATAAASPASTNESLSPLPRAPVQNPFQRGPLRKSLTSHGPAEALLTVPKILHTRVLSDQNSCLIKENNFPSDLANIPLSGGVKTLNAKENGGGAHPPLVPVIPYGSDVSLQTEEAQRVAAALHGRQRSMDDQIYRKPQSVMNGNGKCGGEMQAEKLADLKVKEKRNQLEVEIRQQKEQLTHSHVDEVHFDRELLLWEEKTRKIMDQVESLDASLLPLRNSEKNVISSLKEYSALQLEDALRTNRKCEDALRAEIALIQSHIKECEDGIARSEGQARAVAEQIRGERDAQNSRAESVLREERAELVKELQQLAVMQDSQNRRWDDMGLNEQRLDSTLLAKQLELDSLQSALKKANFDGFLGGIAVKATEETSPDPQDSEMDPLSGTADTLHGTRMENHQPVPAAPSRQHGNGVGSGSAAGQRILVLKRNTARDPQGMWV